MTTIFFFFYIFPTSSQPYLLSLLATIAVQALPYFHHSVISLDRNQKWDELSTQKHCIHFLSEFPAEYDVMATNVNNSTVSMTLSTTITP